MRPRAPGGARLQLLLRDRFASPAQSVPGARGLVLRTKALFEASPGYAFAAFVHLLALVILSFISVAVAVQQQVSRPVEVRLVAQSDVELAPVEDVKALDDVAPPDLDALAEVDTDDPFQEALGTSIGPLLGAAGDALGLAGGGGAGRGGNRYGVGGASRASDGALRAGLDWLKRHQCGDGGWNFIPADHALTGRIAAEGDVGRTSLALLCFLCAGEGPDRDGPYRETVRRAIAWLVQATSKTGELGGQFSGYEQCVGILALAEVFARERSAEVEGALRRAVTCLEDAQDPTRGGWRYRPRDVADTSVTCWAALGLKAAEHAGVPVREETWAGIRLFLESVSKEDGVTTYMANVSRAGPGMVASGLFMRLMLGESPDSSRNQAAARMTAQIASSPRADAYATYYGALAMYQVGGEAWRAFNPKVRDGVVAAIEGGTGCERGSWPHDSGHWMRGDRMLVTTFSILTLETYYRYLPVHEGGGQARRLLADAQTPGQKLFARACTLLDEALRNDEPGLALAAEAAIDEAAAALEQEDAPASRELRVDLLALRVLSAAAAKDGDAIIARSEEYLAALPLHAGVDVDALRARRAALLERALNVARKGADPALSTAERGAIEQRLADIEITLRADVGRYPDGHARVEAEAAVTELATLRRRMALSLSPDLGIADAQRALPPPEKPATHDEVLLLQAVLLRASRLLAGPARAQRSALDRAEADLEWVAARQPERRLPPADRAAFEQARCQAGVLRLAALHAHDRPHDLLVAAAPLRPRLLRLQDASLLQALDALERSALMQRLERGQASDGEQTRLLDMVLNGPLGAQGERPLSWVAVGELMLARGQLDQVRRCAERALACEPAPTQDEAARARLLRARAALQGGDVPSADDDVKALEALGLTDRVDVRLVRAAIHRARGQHDQALTRYQEIVRALDAERPLPWWDAVEGIAGTYVDQRDWPRARRFLDDLRRRDPTFGNDDARKRRIVTLMAWLDAQ